MSLAPAVGGLVTGLVLLPFAWPAYRACSTKRYGRMAALLTAGTVVALPVGYLIGVALI